MEMDFNTFLEQSIEGKLSTGLKPCPEGDYAFMIDDGDNWATKQAGEAKETGNPYFIFKVKMTCADERVKQILGRDTVIVDYDCFMEFDANGQIATGEGNNVRLGRLRKALNQNEDGAWSPMMLRGRGPVMCTVKHDPNPDDPEFPRAKISYVKAMG